MPGRCIFPRRIASLAAVAGLLVAGAAAAQQADKRPAPLPAGVQKAVLKYFEADRDYCPGDLITREQVGPLVGRLRRIGFSLPDARKILADVPAQDEFLPRQFATPDGRSFMRQISAYPDPYDKLDRLSRLPLGRQTIRDLIRGPDGYKMLQYMTTTSGGRELNGMLSNSPGAGDFNAPTGRIYTVERLLDRLRRSHDAMTKANQKRSNR